MHEILVTNDDGVHSEGIKALASALHHLGNVTIVAPMQEASAIGHALTLRRPLRIETIAPKIFGIDGTPTDCVNLAIAHIIRQKPDLIVSGINKGWNLGDDVTYSGTVSGALEGALLGIPAIAVSTQNFHRRNDVDERIDPRKRPYYWIEEGENEWEPHDRSDYQAVRDGYISITPLQPDMTAHEALKFLEDLPLDAPTPVR